MQPLSFIGLDDPRSLKRYITLLLGIGAVSLHDKLGITLDQHQQDLIAAMVTAALLGSNYLDAAKAKAQSAADAILTPEDADKVALRKGPPVGMWIALVLGATLLWSSTAHAQPAPTDAPVAELTVVKKGDIVPHDGRLYSNDFHVLTMKRVVTCETTLKEVEPAVGTKWWIPVLVGLGTAVVVGGVAYGVGVAVGKGHPQGG